VGWFALPSQVYGDESVDLRFPGDDTAAGVDKKFVHSLKYNGPKPISPHAEALPKLKALAAW
jgi:hypothetical protein